RTEHDPNGSHHRRHGVPGRCPRARVARHEPSERNRHGRRLACSVESVRGVCCRALLDRPCRGGELRTRDALRARHRVRQPAPRRPSRAPHPVASLTRVPYSRPMGLMIRRVDDVEWHQTLTQQRDGKTVACWNRIVHTTPELTVIYTWYDPG